MTAAFARACAALALALATSISGCSEKTPAAGSPAVDDCKAFWQSSEGLQAQLTHAENHGDRKSEEALLVELAHGEEPCIAVFDPIDSNRDAGYARVMHLTLGAARDAFLRGDKTAACDRVKSAYAVANRLSTDVLRLNDPQKEGHAACSSAVYPAAAPA